MNRITYNPLIICCFLFLFGVTACVKNNATGNRQLVILSQEKENNIGAREHPKVIKAFGGIYNNKILQNYIDRIGKKVALNSEFPNIRWTFTILDTPLVNAFALPGGYIYITRGLLSLANDEAEVASVLGHEIGHVTARHTAERHAKSTFSNIGLEVLDIIVGQPIVSNLANIGLQGVLSSFSRSQELEADKLGIRYIRKSHYDPYGSVRFLKRLDSLVKISSENNKNFINSIFATHPKTLDRAEYTKFLSDNSGDNLNNKNRENYLNAIDRMVYGESSKHGVVKNNQFLHLDLNFTFSVPAGYSLVNNDNAVISHNSDNEVVVIFDGMNNDEGITLREIIEANVGRSRIINYEELSINNRLAISVEDRNLVNYNGSKFYRKVFLIKWNEAKVWRFSILITPNLKNKYTLESDSIPKSLNSLSIKEKKLAQPKYIKILKVEVSDTIEYMSQQMAVLKNKKELFCLINGLECNDEDNALKNGSLIKMISD